MTHITVWKTFPLKTAPSLESQNRGILQEVPPRLDEPMLVPIPDEKEVPKLPPRGACGPGTERESTGTYSHAHYRSQSPFLKYQMHT